MSTLCFPAPLDANWLPKEQSDEFLVARARLGESEAFDDLVRRHRSAVFATALRIVEQTEDAEDVVQETFLSALVHLHTFRGEAAFRTWLLRLAVNEALTILRRRRRRALDLAEEITEGAHEQALARMNPVKTPEELLTENESRSRMERLIARLTEPYRRTMRLWACESRSVAEISSELGITEGAVKTRLHRARARLAQYLPRPQGATKN